MKQDAYTANVLVAQQQRIECLAAYVSMYNCYCIKCPAEIFIEIRVCLRLSRSPGPSGSHYHSSSRIAIPDRKDKTLSSNLQLPPAIRQKTLVPGFLSLLMTSFTK